MVHHARALLACLAVVAVCVVAADSADAAEVGYVESFAGPPHAISIERDGSAVPVAILTPIEDGDVVEVLDAQASLILRLVDRPEPLVLTRSDGRTTITAGPSAGGFWSGLLAWTATNVGALDKAERNRLPEGVRGLTPGGDSGLSAPMLNSAQTILASRRPLFIGWKSPSTVRVRLTSAETGAEIASGEGVGGIWSSGSIDIAPGHYRLELRVPGEMIEVSLEAVAEAELPTPPSELEREGIPPELRKAALAAWLASQSDSYLLESLQHIAPNADRYRASKLLAGAFIAGQRPPPP